MLSFIASLLISIPFWIVYSLCGIGEKFFYFLPVVYQAPGYWNTVGLFTVFFLLKGVVVVRFQKWTEIEKELKEIYKKRITEGK